jgi:tryptophan-rich sensory protein
VRKYSEWMPAIIALSVALVVLFGVSFVDKNSDIYYKNLKKPK